MATAQKKEGQHFESLNIIRTFGVYLARGTLTYLNTESV